MKRYGPTPLSELVGRATLRAAHRARQPTRRQIDAYARGTLEQRRQRAKRECEMMAQWFRAHGEEGADMPVLKFVAEIEGIDGNTLRVDGQESVGFRVMAAQGETACLDREGVEQLQQFLDAWLVGAQPNSE